MIDIESWVIQTFNDIQHKGDEILANCPFCHLEGLPVDINYHLHIGLDSFTHVHCFRCEYSSTWFGLVAKYERCTIGQAKEIIKSDLTPLYVLQARKEHREARAAKQQQAVDTSMPSSFMTLQQAKKHAMGSKAIRDSLLKVWRFCEKRRIMGLDNWATIKRTWGIFDAPEWFAYLVIPVENGFWQARRTKLNAPAKYKSKPVPKTGVLYNAQALQQFNMVHITEGVISAEFVGPTAVALCGKKATLQQAIRLYQSPVKVFVICLDDNTDKDIVRLADMLVGHDKAVLVRKYKNGDPADEGSSYKEYTYANMVKAKILAGML